MAYEPELVQFIDKCETKFIYKLVDHFKDKSEEERMAFIDTMEYLDGIIQGSKLE